MLTRSAEANQQNEESTNAQKTEEKQIFTVQKV